MVKRLAEGWDRERHVEFGSKPVFFKYEDRENWKWHHWHMVPEVLEFLKEFETDEDNG